MATDIAFALGILSLLGNRVPLSLKIFLTALAIDDLGAIMVHILHKTILWSNLLRFRYNANLFVLNRMKVKSLIPYLLVGYYVVVYVTLRIHATVTGVLLAFVIPFGNGDKDSSVLQHFLHKPVGFLILPLLHWQIRR
jgi:NhaA family Na+:H+ antiporter